MSIRPSTRAEVPRLPRPLAPRGIPDPVRRLAARLRPGPEADWQPVRADQPALGWPPAGEARGARPGLAGHHHLDLRLRPPLAARAHPVLPGDPLLRARPEALHLQRG